MIKSPLILLAGRARAGKDTFANLLTERVQRDGRTMTRLAYADELKREIDPFLKLRHGISAWTQDNAEKAIIRPDLVAWGKMRRNENPDYWIRKVAPAATEALRNGNVVVLTDNRYGNEAKWGQFLGGKVVYIERTLPDGSIVPAANEEEATNDPDVRAAADIFVKWDTLPLDKLSQIVDDVWSQVSKSA